MTFSGSQRVCACSKCLANCPEETWGLTELSKDQKNYHAICLIVFCSFLLSKVFKMFLLNARALFFWELLGLSHNFEVLMSLLESLGVCPCPSPARAALWACSAGCMPADEADVWPYWNGAPAASGAGDSSWHLDMAGSECLSQTRRLREPWGREHRVFAAL